MTRPPLVKKRPRAINGTSKLIWGIDGKGLLREDPEGEDVKQTMRTVYCFVICRGGSILGLIR